MMNSLSPGNILVTLSARTSVLLFTLAAVASIAVACGGGGSEDEDAATEEGVREAAQHNVEMLIDNDVQGLYRSMSASCQDRLAYDDFAGVIALARGGMESTYQVELSDLEVSEVRVESFTPTSATAYTTLAVKGEEDLTIGGGDGGTYIYEDGAWAASDCEEMIALVEG